MTDLFRRFLCRWGLQMEEDNVENVDDSDLQECARFWSRIDEMSHGG